MVSGLDSGLNSLGSSLGLRALHWVLGQHTLLSQCLSPFSSINRYQLIVGATRQNAGE